MCRKGPTLLESNRYNWKGQVFLERLWMVSVLLIEGDCVLFWVTKLLSPYELVYWA